jgi:hypothetical protein
LNDSRSRRVRTALILTAVAGALLPAGPAARALATSDVGGPISRAEVIQRAKTWTDAHVPYSQSTRPSQLRDGYRRDCSGFVSMAWHLSTNHAGADTDALAHVADPITKDQLATGDVLLMTHAESRHPEEGGHVVIFLNWADAAHTQYLAMEEAGGEGAVMHVLPYPYYPGYGTFHPYHYGKVIDNVQGQNLLADGGFEGDAGWDQWPGSNLSTKRGDGKAHGGDGYGAVNTGSLDPSQGPSFFQDVWGARLEPGATYVYTLWVRPETDRPFQGRLDLWVIGEDGRQERAETAFTAAPGGWRQVSVAETVPATGYHHLRAQMYEDTPHDTLDVDDAAVSVRS